MSELRERGERAFHVEGRTSTVTVAWTGADGSGRVGNLPGCSPKGCGWDPRRQEKESGFHKGCSGAQVLMHSLLPFYLLWVHICSLSISPPEGSQGKAASSLFAVLSEGLFSVKFY